MQPLQGIALQEKEDKDEKHIGKLLKTIPKIKGRGAGFFSFFFFFKISGGCKYKMGEQTFISSL